MILADTNVVVRFLMVDDPLQARRAKAVVEAGDVLLLLSVVLEVEWVLRTAYGVPRPALVNQIRTFASLPGIRVEDPERLALALDLAARGFDFADALHLAATPPGAAVVTFDRALVRAAQALGLDAREPPPAPRGPAP